MDIEKLFSDLESNNTQEYENAKKIVAENFGHSKEPWFINGMLDYYLRTSSMRIIDVIIKVQAPHDTYIFDRLSEWLRGSNKLAALAVFDYIVRKHPTWLYKVAKHRFIKDILKYLQTEKEIIPLMSALLCIITLLPIIPSLVPNILPDLFDIFGNLASWNCQNSKKLSENQLIHLQIGLHLLFLRLYGMYPCNFMHYLREFKEKEKGAVFQHTVKPLLETVRMHPNLVTLTKETEINNARWNGVEPHDVVVECAKLSLDYCRDGSDCSAGMVLLRSQDTYSIDTPVTIELRNSLRNTPFQQCNQHILSPLSSLQKRLENLNDGYKFDSIWSPTTEILSTPPPTGTVPHTPTPSYQVPLLPNTVTSAVLGGAGASPPEAAVEATPETTPMKDMNLKRAPVVGSSAVRSILTSSQPSSPMRKEQSSFNFHEAGIISGSGVSTSSRLLQMRQDRSQAQIFMLNRSNSAESAAQHTSINNNSNAVNFQQDFHVMARSVLSFKSGPVTSLDSPTLPTESTQEDQEVTELTSQHLYPHNSDTLQDISNECDDETERSPCSAGGLHVPNTLSMRMLGRGIRRNRMGSYCLNDTSCYLSCGTSPADNFGTEQLIFAVARAKLIRAKSWPIIERRPSKEENSAELEAAISNKNQDVTQQNGDTSSPSGDDAISAATHFKQLQQKKDLKCSKFKKFEKLDSLKSVSSLKPLKSMATQTVEQWSHLYEYNLLELYAEDNKIRNSSEKHVFQPYAILEEYIKRTVNMKQSGNDGKSGEELLKEQIQLLHLQLQYEQYRREIHAERNRRLLGKSRTLRSLEMDNERLQNQLKELQGTIQFLTDRFNTSRKEFTEQIQDLSKESNLWKSKYQSELEDNKKLRSDLEYLQRRLKEETQSKEELNYKNELLQGEIFDLRNDMQQAQFKVELGNQYKQDLEKLEAEFMVVGEIQVKCRDKLTEIDNLKARDEEILHLQETYNEEITELRSTLEEKTAQLDSARHRLSELQTQLSHKEINFTDQKRCLKTVKDKYEEKFKALNEKYEAQKNIIQQMEEKILELLRNESVVNKPVFSPENSEKTGNLSISDMTVDFNSPLSASLASSESLSASLRSVSEIRNLQALVVQPNTASGQQQQQQYTTTAPMGTTGSIAIPVSFSTANTQTTGAAGVVTVPLQQQQSIGPTISNTKRGSTTQHFQHHQVIHQTAAKTTTTRSSFATPVTIATSSASVTLSSSSSLSSYSGSKAQGTSFDIPVPGPSQQHKQQHHTNVRHQYSTHHR